MIGEPFLWGCEEPPKPRPRREFYGGPPLDVMEVMYPGFRTRKAGSTWDEKAQLWVDPPLLPHEMAAGFFGHDGPERMVYRCTEVYDDGIRHPDGRWEPKAKSSRSMWGRINLSDRLFGHLWREPAEPFTFWGIRG